ncbi:MAG: hypothetical protein LBV63_02115 [Candidatus Methanoplasma sp.]|jgi:KEOPS complex subunit Cgi121|nr:hypothetical protein [Candidatus Methanoplasma sp.]
MKDVKVIGIRGGASFDEIVSHFTGLGGEVVLLDPEMVCGKDHIISAVAHAERSFLNGTNRSKTILTEIILYAAGDRQIGRATEKMRPKPDADGMVAVLLDVDDLRLEDIGLERCDSIMDASENKAINLDIDEVPGVPYEDLILERVAMVDLMKQ